MARKLTHDSREIAARTTPPVRRTRTPAWAGRLARLRARLFLSPGTLPMSDLINQARALRNLNGQSLTVPELAVLDGVVSAASHAIETYCRRSFGLVNRDERHDGQDDPILIVHHYPIAAIDRVACAPTPVLSVANDSGSVQRATVRVVATGVMLTRVASGVATVDTINFASAATLASLATAIGGLGNGWSASVVSSIDGALASADLAACPGTWAARAAPAELRMHVREVTDYELDARLGVLRRVLGWPGGASYYRVVYTAGYSAVPDDVQEACAQLAAQMYWQTKRDPGLASESMLSALTRRPVEGWPVSVRDLLAPYRRVPRV